MATWTEDAIRNLLWTKPAAVERGIIALYRRQTSDEQNSYETRHRNGVGFSGAHSRTGTHWAKILLASPKPEGQRLWGKGLEKLRSICLHYVGQLTEEANKPK